MQVSETKMVCHKSAKFYLSHRSSIFRFLCAMIKVPLPDPCINGELHYGSLKDQFAVERYAVEIMFNIGFRSTLKAGYIS